MIPGLVTNVTCDWTVQIPALRALGSILPHVAVSDVNRATRYGRTGAWHLRLVPPTDVLPLKCVQTYLSTSPPDPQRMSDSVDGRSRANSGNVRSKELAVVRAVVRGGGLVGRSTAAVP